MTTHSARLLTPIPYSAADLIEQASQKPKPASPDCPAPASPSSKYSSRPGTFAFLYRGYPVSIAWQPSGWQASATLSPRAQSRRGFFTKVLDLLRGVPWHGAGIRLENADIAVLRACDRRYQRMLVALCWVDTENEASQA